MIINDYQMDSVVIHNVESMLNLMKQSKFKFALTGSRLFGGVHSNSDWDFFVEHSQHLELDLESIGFRNISTKPPSECHQYTDSSISKVMEMEFSDGIVQIQLLQKGMFGTKYQAQKFLVSRYGVTFSNFTKDERKLLWKNTLSLLTTVKGDEVFNATRKEFKNNLEHFNQPY